MLREWCRTFQQRLALSAAVIGAIATVALSVWTWSAESVSREAQHDAIAEEAAKAGLLAYEFNSRATSECYTRFHDAETSASCVNARLFGGFGERLDWHRERVIAWRVATIAAQAVFFAIIAYFAALFAACCAYPWAIRYFSWLRGTK